MKMTVRFFSFNNGCLALHGPLSISILEPHVPSLFESGSHSCPSWVKASGLKEEKRGNSCPLPGSAAQRRWLDEREGNERKEERSGTCFSRLGHAGASCERRT